MLFSIFVSNSGIERNPSKLANDNKLCGAVNTLEGKDAIRTRANPSISAGWIENRLRTALMRALGCVC